MDIDETERNVSTETTLGRITEVGLYGKDRDRPGLTINGAVYLSSVAMSTYAGGLLGKPVVADTRGGWVVALRPATVSEGDGLADVPEGLRRVEAAAHAAESIMTSGPRLSVRFTPSSEPGRVEFHVWDDATGQQMPDDAPETHGVLMWLAYTCESLFSAWVGEQDKAMRSDTW